MCPKHKTKHPHTFFTKIRQAYDMEFSNSKGLLLAAGFRRQIQKQETHKCTNPKYKIQSGLPEKRPGADKDNDHDHDGKKRGQVVSKE